MKLARYVIIVISVVSKFTASYVEAREDQKGTSELLHTKLQEKNDKNTNNSSKLGEPQLEKDAIIFIHKYQRGRRVPMFDCLQTKPYSRKLIIPHYRENLDQINRANSYLFKVTWVTPRQEIDSLWDLKSNATGKHTFRELIDERKIPITMRSWDEINLGSDYTQYEIDTSTKPRISSSTPYNLSYFVVTSPKSFITSVVQVTTSRVPVKHKVTPAYHNVVSPKYEEEPDIKNVDIINKFGNYHKQSKCDNILVINAPSNIGGLPVVVVPDRNNNSVRLSLKKQNKTIGRKTSGKYHGQINVTKLFDEYDPPGKMDDIGDTTKGNFYMTSQNNRPLPPWTQDPRYEALRKIEATDRLSVVPQLKHYFTELSSNPFPETVADNPHLTDMQREINRQLVQNLIRMLKKKIITREINNKKCHEKSTKK